MNEQHYAAIEAGGTKFRVAVACGRDIVADTTIPTTTPAETLDATVEFLSGFAQDGFELTSGELTLTTTPTEYTVFLTGATYTTIAGGFGADTVTGGAGEDVLTGSAL